jgi:hypothetical protein
MKHVHPLPFEYLRATRKNFTLSLKVSGHTPRLGFVG